MNFRFADFEINVARRELRRAGAIVHTEPQVFDLLVHLIRNRDRIVCKDELIDAICRVASSRRRRMRAMSCHRATSTVSLHPGSRSGRLTAKTFT